MRSEAPRGSPRGISSTAWDQAASALVRGLVILNILLNHIRSHPVSYCTYKIPILPQFSSPQPPLQRWKLAKQLPNTINLDYLHHLSNRPLGRKRQQYVNMIHCQLQLHSLKTILIADLPNQLFRSLSYVHSPKYFLPILRTPHQMDNSYRRPNDSYTWLLCNMYIIMPRKGLGRKRGTLSAPPYNPQGKACSHPRGKLGDSAKFC